MNARSEMSHTHIQASFPSWTRLWLFPFLSSSVFSKQNARRVAVYSTLEQSPNFPLAQIILISSVLFSLYVNDMPIPSHHVELARTTRPSVTSNKPGLLVSYLESYLTDLERWLREWRIAINVSKSTAMLFTSKRIQNLRPVLLFGEPIIWVDTARYLGVILDKRLTWSSHIDQVGNKVVQRMGVLGSLPNRSGLSIRNGVLL
jgi:hypothetical protein